MNAATITTVGLAGFGTVGQELARRLTAGAIPETFRKVLGEPTAKGDAEG